MDEIYELVNHLAHQVAMKDEKLSMIAGKDRREYMDRMREGRESIMRLIELVEEAQVEKCKKEAPNGFLFEPERVSQQLTE